MSLKSQNPEFLTLSRNFRKMTPPMFAGWVTCLLLGTITYTSALKASSSLRFESVDVGQDIKLTCSYEESSAVVYFWFKQTLGQKPELLSEFFKHEPSGYLKGEFQNDPRIGLETGPGKNHLKISNVQISDSASYYCVSGYSYVFDHLEGIIVHVKGSGSMIQTSVHQPESETIQPGGTKTLNCTVHTGICDGEYSVYWFKDSGESFSRVVYSSGVLNDKCERNPNTKTNTCVSNLPRKNLDTSDAGTYYCAVVSCGHILFGNGTKLDFEINKDRSKADSSFLLHVLSGALAFSNILVVMLAYTVYKEKSSKSKDPPERSSVTSAPDAEGSHDEDSLHYAALRDMNLSRSRRERDEPSHEYVYSSVRRLN